MGTYTNASDVKSLFRRLKIEADTGVEATNTVITTEEVDQFIEEQELLVTSRLSKYYDMTLVGSESSSIINMIVRYKVAHVIKNIMALTTSAMTNRGDSDRKQQEFSGNWDKMANDILDKIAPINSCGGCFTQPITPLPDTPLLSIPPTAASVFGASSVAAPVFTKAGNNW